MEIDLSDLFETSKSKIIDHVLIRDVTDDRILLNKRGQEPTKIKPEEKEDE
jgi:hypothetical protein